MVGNGFSRIAFEGRAGGDSLERVGGRLIDWISIARLERCFPCTVY